MEGTSPRDLRKAIQSVDRNRALLERAESLVYRETETRSLLAHVFKPPGGLGTRDRPAMLFFHGSLWEKGLVSQFAPHAYYFAQRGVVSVLFEYRLRSVDGTGPVEALEDIAAGIRWVHSRPDLLGVNNAHQILCGASGGAWAALAWTLGLLAEKEAERPFPLPTALALFEPLVDVGPKRPGFEHFPNKEVAKELNPMRLLAEGLPPAMFLHGTADAVLPFEATRKFARKWEKKKGRCDLVPFAGAAHGFHNFSHDMRMYEQTVNAVDAFLVSLGLIGASERLVTQ